MTAPEPEACTSKFPRKLARDIYLSMDIGRSSPFDPFAAGDLTKLFADRKPPSSGLSYFAEKPLRKTKGAYLFAKMPDSHANGGRMYPVVCDASYDAKLPPTAKDVSFTTAKRFSTDPPLQQPRRHAATPQHGGGRGSTSSPSRRSPVASMNSTLLGTSAGAGSRSGATASAATIPFSVTRTVRTPYEPRGIIAKVDVAHAPTLGPRSGPQLSPRFRPKSETAVAFPWERQAAAEKRKATQQQQLQQQQQQTSSAAAAAAGSEAVVVGDGGSGAGAASASAQQQSQQAPEEDWNREHRSLIARLGLVGGGGRKERARRKARPRGADFSTTTGRDAPTPWLAPGKEIHENTYHPKFDVTTRERKRNADVRLDSYASRVSEEAPHLVTARQALSLGNVIRFHALQRRRERESALALPDAPQTDAGRPLTAADDFSALPSSLYPPSTSLTRKFKGVPDVGLYADRPDLPLAQLLGPDPRRYFRAARKEMEAEEAALQRQEEEERKQALSLLDF